MPDRLDTPDESMPQSGMVVEPTMTAPCSSRRSTTGESRSGITPAVPATPACAGMPARTKFSFTVTGTPSSGPRCSPRSHRAAEAAASWSTWAGSRSVKALISGLRAAMSASTDSAASTGVNSPDAYPAVRAAPVISIGAVMVGCAVIASPARG